MKILQVLFSFYIISSTHVSIAVTSLLWITLELYGLSHDLILYGVVFLGTIIGYNFVKYGKLYMQHKKVISTELNVIRYYTLVCSLVLIGLLIQLPIETIILFAVFGFLTVLYTIPFFKKKNLRTLAGLKIFIVAFVWAGVTVYIPLFRHTFFDTNVWIDFIQRFLFVFVITIPFEIRDATLDADYLKTLPQRYGAKKAKVIGFALLVLCVLVEGFKDDITYLHTNTFLFICGVTGVCLAISKNQQSRYFASFWVEGIPLLWCFILVLLSHFLA